MTFAERITKPQWRNIILAFCYCRLVGAAVYGLIYHQAVISGEVEEYVPLWYEWLYYISAAALEVVMLLCAFYLTNDKIRIYTQQFNLFIGFAVFNLFEEVFLKPNSFDAAEYWGVVVGFGFMLISYLWRLRKRKRT